VLREAIDASRRQLLAEAWLDKVASGKTVSREEVHGFYVDNPALFSERRIYRMRELSVAAPAALADVLRAEAARTHDLDELAGWLRMRDARFSASSATLPSEQVPLGHLAQLAGMKDGEIAVFALPATAGAEGAFSVVQLVHAEDAPLSEAQAMPLIEQFLAGRKRLELAAAEVRRLREVASIEYAGEFKRSN
jgi:EpsD family peptidyl-prolyl cis-trans isomerase